MRTTGRAHGACSLAPTTAMLLLALGACSSSKPEPHATGAAGSRDGGTPAGAAGAAAGTGGASGATGGADTTGAAGSGTDAAAAGTSGAAGATTDGGADDLTPPCTGPACTACGFIMPNAVGTGLPNPASYTVDKDNNVTDNVTGLVWEGTLSCPFYSTESSAAAYCASRGADWRLPTRLELRSIVDLTRPAPTIDPSFVNRPSTLFWTSLPDLRVVSFVNGGTQDGTGHTAPRARCVRTGSSRCFQARFEVRAGGLVYDRTTGLTWQQTLDPASHKWADATALCAARGAPWRLPSLGELETILDDAKPASATGTAIIDAVLFPDTPRASFWTSSGGGPTAAWGVDFGIGRDMRISVEQPLSVRCVRGGTPAGPRPADGGTTEAGDAGAADAAAAPPPAVAECIGHIDGDLVCRGAEVRRCTGALSGAALVQTCSGATPDCVGGACVACADPARCQCGGFPMPNAGAGAAVPNKPSYKTNQDGTVTDNVTGLIWEQPISMTGGPRPMGSVADCSTNFTQAAAAAYCASKGSTWRLPTRIELISLVDFTVGQPGPQIDDTTFPATPAAGFWTSTLSKRYAGGEAWFFDFLTGEAYTAPVGPLGTTTGNFNVRCVRSSAPRCYPQRFTSQPDAGTVMDRALGLSWQQVVPAGDFTWDQATAFCAMKGGGWRLPTLPEALALVDDTRANPALDTTVFPGPFRSAAMPKAPDTFFWTSTPVPRDSIGGVFLVDYSDGLNYPGATDLGHSVRCVR